MSRPRSLLDIFQELEHLDDGRLRGVRFEGLIGDLFRDGGFVVESDAGIASPRQTDLVATRGESTYLVEVKWQGRPVGVGGIDSLRSRLASTPASVVGVFVSASGFSRNAVRQVEATRARPIVLLDAADIRRFLGSGDLSRALRRRERTLVVHGKAQLADSQGEANSVRAARGRLVPGRAQFLLPDGRRAPWWGWGGGYGSLCFATDLRDIDWVTAGGAGVSLDVGLPLVAEADVLAVVRALDELGWVTDAGRFNIEQAVMNWHGIGSEAFGAALSASAARYEGLERVHHTENVSYVDECEGGFYSLTADISAQENRRVWHSDLSFQLQGIPLELERFNRLFDVLDVDHPVYFRPRVEKSVAARHPGSGAAQVELECLAYVAEWDEQLEEDWVSAIVAANPFPRAETASDLSPPEWWPDPLRYSEVIICGLRDWHPLDRERRLYTLGRVEWAWTSEILVCRPAADWDRHVRS